MSELGPIAKPGGAADADTQEAATKLEAYFLRRVLAEVRIGGDSMLAGSFAGETFQHMPNEALADTMAEAGGLGISDVFVDQPAAGVPTAMSGQLRAYRAADSRLSVMPVAGRVSSSFGSRVHPLTGARKQHTGVDIAAPQGTPVRAAAAGVVVRAERAGGYGNLVEVDHGNGLSTRYGHMSKIDVKTGQQVAIGQTIGRIGSTGRSTGPHLHYGTRINDKAVGPQKFLRAGLRLGSGVLGANI